MCQVYHNKTTGSFVRLCYVHKARRGQHVPVVAGFVLGGAHFSFHRDAASIRGPVDDSGTRRPARRRSPSLTFRLPDRLEECTAGAIQEMARWAHAQAERDGDLVTLRPLGKWVNTQPIVDRARTFGWQLQEPPGEVTR